MKRIIRSSMKVTRMFKEVIILFAFMVIFCSISTCWTQFIKHPAKVTIKEATASLPYNYELTIEANYKTWNLLLAPMENIWSNVAQEVSVTKDENRETSFELKNIPRNLQAYRDVKTGSILSIKENEINGILDSHNSILCENEIHFIVQREKETKEKFYDVFVPHEISSKDYEVRGEYKINPTTMNDAVLRMSGIRNSKPIYTPEILVIVDSELANAIGTDSQIYSYLTLFWNEVKVQYQYIEDPIINIRLTGVRIIRNPEDEPFITNNLNENNSISLLEVILDLEKYVYSRNHTLPRHDIVYLQTNKNSTENGGLAVVGGACKKDAAPNVSLSVAVGLDSNAVFAGTVAAAHEIGHLLGADHDNKSINTCDFDDGYLMGNPHGTRNSYYFSNCSLDSIATNLAGSWAACLLTQFNETTPPDVFNSTVLPGYVISMKDQCRYLTGDNTADIQVTTPEDKLCYNLQCVTKRGPRNMHVRAAEGSLCPSGKRCSFGACV